MDGNLRILVFSLEYPPFIGGAGCFSSDLAGGLCELGHDITVLTRDYGDGLAHTQKVGEGLVRIVRFPWVKHLGFYYWPILLWRFLHKFRQKFDFILITESKAQAVSAMISRRYLGRYGIVIHGEELQRHFGPRNLARALLYSRNRTRELFENSTSLISISKSTQCAAQAIGYVTHKLLLGVDTNIFKRGDSQANIGFRRKLGLSEQDIVVFTASRLHIEKGHETLLRAIALIQRSIPNVKLLIAGVGPDRERLEVIAAEMKISSSIRFLGPVVREELPPFYQASDLFVLASRRENFGLVYIEANACGRTVVGGRVGGVPEAVEDGVSGLLVDPESPEEVASAMLKVLLDSEFRSELERSAYSRVMEGFTRTRMAQKVITYCGLNGESNEISG